jgi:glutamate-5-semialdehyde dehydrogenase
MIASLADLMRDMGAAARNAAQALALTATKQKNQALRAAAAAVRSQAGTILAANALDVREAESKNLSAALIDRLRLDGQRIEAMAHGLEDIGELSDPVNVLL